MNWRVSVMAIVAATAEPTFRIDRIQRFDECVL